MKAKVLVDYFKTQSALNSTEPRTRYAELREAEMVHYEAVGKVPPELKPVDLVNMVLSLASRNNRGCSEVARNLARLPVVVGDRRSVDASWAYLGLLLHAAVLSPEEWEIGKLLFSCDGHYAWVIVNDDLIEFTDQEPVNYPSRYTGHLFSFSHIQFKALARIVREEASDD